MIITESYIEGNYRITKYDNGTVEKVIIGDGQLEQLNPSLEEQVTQLKNDNLILMDALATVFEELLNTQVMIGGIL